MASNSSSEDGPEHLSFQFPLSNHAGDSNRGPHACYVGIYQLEPHFPLLFRNETTFIQFLFSDNTMEYPSWLHLFGNRTSPGDMWGAR